MPNVVESLASEFNLEHEIFVCLSNLREMLQIAPNIRGTSHFTPYADGEADLIVL